MDGGRVGEIIGRHVDRLDRGDRPAIRTGDALLALRQFRTHRWLVAEPRRHLPHQARYFGACLDEAEDVVDEQKHIAMLIIAEIFGYRQRRVADAESGARRLVHLAEQHHHALEDGWIFPLVVKIFFLSWPPP